MNTFTKQWYNCGQYDDPCWKEMSWPAVRLSHWTYWHVGHTGCSLSGKTIGQSRAREELQS